MLNFSWRSQYGCAAGASGETLDHSGEISIPTFTDPPPGLDLISLGAYLRGRGEDEQDGLLARGRVGFGGRGCHMGRTLLYQALFAYTCGEFARRSPVVAV